MRTVRERFRTDRVRKTKENSGRVIRGTKTEWNNESNERK